MVILGYSLLPQQSMRKPGNSLENFFAVNSLRQEIKHTLHPLNRWKDQK
jgi:hypothetical protein